MRRKRTLRFTTQIMFMLAPFRRMYRTPSVFLVQKIVLFFCVSLCCVLFTPGSVSAQSKVIDSIQTLLREQEGARKYDTLIVENLLKFTEIVSNSNVEQAQRYAERCLEISKQMQFSRGTARTYLLLARIATNRGQFSIATEYIEQCITLCQRMGNKQNIADAYGHLGRIWLLKGDYRQALNYYQKSFTLCKELHYDSGLLRATYNLTDVYRVRGEYEEALEYAFRCLQKAEEMNDGQNAARAYSTLGTIYRDLGKYPEAINTANKAIALWQSLSAQGEYTIPISLRKLTKAFCYLKLQHYDTTLQYCGTLIPFFQNANDKHNLVIALVHTARAYTGLRQYDQALATARRAWDIAQETKNTQWIISALTASSEALGNLNRHKEAITQAEEALRIAWELRNGDVLLESIQALSDAYLSAGMTDKSFESYKRYVAVKDSILTRTVAQKSEELKIRYEADKREQEITILQKDKALQSLALEQQETELARNQAEARQQEQRFALLNSEKQIQNLTLERQGTFLAEAQLLRERDRQSLDLAEKDKLLTQAELQRRTILQWSFGLGFVCVGVAAAWLAVLYRNNKQANVHILSQQAILEEQTQEIEIVNSALSERNQELEVVNMEKNEMLGIVAHDLKNPIVAVRGLAELVSTGFAEAEQIPEVTKQITLTADRMLDLVKNLLDVNQLESGGMQFQVVEFDIESIALSVLEQYQISAATKNITLHFTKESENTIVHADEPACMQVLDNLLSNAVKYSPYGKNIFMRLKSGTSKVRIEVADEGQGISPDDMKKLFGKFARLSAQPTGGEHSTGLGLSIVKKMVEAMNGKVWCESELGKGATFVVELPAVV